MNYSRNTQRAIDKYTRDGCIKAFVLNTRDGEGASTISLQYDIPNVRTTRSADAAIDAGLEIMEEAEWVVMQKEAA